MTEPISDATTAADARTFSVYVIELDPTAAPDPGAGCLYVGETALTPQGRWERHKSGGRTASKVVARFGRRLRPDLSAGIGPFSSRAAAVEAEAGLAAELRGRGYVVFGGQGHTFRMAGARGPADDGAPSDQ